MARTEDFDKSVVLPPGLTIAAIKKSVEYIERELSSFVEIYLEQMNVFSAIVGIFGSRLTGTAFTKRSGISISHKPDFLICADAAQRQLKLSIV